MYKIAIRTNFNSRIGIGHLIRMNNLAKSFKENQIFFLLDNVNEISKKILKFKQFSIYKKNEIFVSQLDDAKKTNHYLKLLKIDKLIVDDYRLNSIWEKKILKDIKILVFDDNNQNKHFCDVIVDSKWERQNTFTRYSDLVPTKTIRLLGPKYTILGSKSYTKTKKKNFDLLFYIGGGGDFKYYYNFLSNISNSFKENKYFKINVVIGPLAKNYKRLINLEEKIKNLKLIKNKLDLSDYLKKTDLFVGTSGSIIYQLNYYKVPSVIFSDQKNQENNFETLNDLGLPLSIRKEDFKKDPTKISELIKIIYNDYKRFKKMINPTINIDIFGAQRIKNIFIKKSKSKKIYYQRIYDNKLSNGIYPVEDKFVNYYLESRNLLVNREKSINKRKIKNLDHYIWWFSNDIKKYLFIRKKKIRIFFNHKILKLNNKKFYYGGWFITKNSYKILDIIKVIKWQIRNFTNYPWLALIQKKNKFVYSLNTYLGFRKFPFKNEVNKFNLKKFKKNYHILIN